MVKKKVQVTAVAALFATLVWLLPSIGGAETKKRTCGPQPGHRLQHFLDELNPGDTLLVSGVCTENVRIGVGRRNLTIDGQGTAVITGPDPTEPTVDIRGVAITIRGFTITGGREGVHIARGGDAIIDGNIIENVGTSGIGVHNIGSARILNNTIQNNPMDGINVIGGSNAFIGIRSVSNLVAGPNTIQTNGRHGVLVTRGSNARVVGNTISGNGENGVIVTRTSHADVSSNTIDNNGENGIFVSQNSGVNLGSDAGAGVLEAPNSTTVNNGLNGIRCRLNSYADGRLGTLNGASGAKSFNVAAPGINDGGCHDSLIP